MWKHTLQITKCYELEPIFNFEQFIILWTSFIFVVQYFHKFWTLNYLKVTLRVKLII